MRLSSLDVSTTNGMLLARIVPSFGMLICHTLSNSHNKASNAWSPLSNSSISAGARDGFFLASVRNVIPNDISVKSLPERVSFNATSDAQNFTSEMRGSYLTESEKQHKYRSSRGSDRD